MNRLTKWLTFAQLSGSSCKSILIEGKKAESKAERKTERIHIAFVFSRVYTKEKTQTAIQMN